jgi:putative tryptophan/tyrosine transport system substrate-binding protein
MKRRNLLCRAPVWLLAPTLAQAQSGPRLLVLVTAFARLPSFAEGETLTRQELTRLGWRVGDNLRLEFRYGDNRPERLDALAREVVAMQPSVVLAWEDIVLDPLLRHTKTIPVVCANMNGDPVAAGLAASLRRPGGQVTGTTMLFTEIRPKTYELARQVAPSARRLAGMFDRRIIPEAQFDAAMAGLSRIAQQVGLEYLPLPVRDVGEIEAALRSLTPVREHVLLLNADMVTYPNFGTIAALARTLRLPSGAQHKLYVQEGGLFSYGYDPVAIGLRSVQMVDQVLRGQPVGEIPIEQPTRIALTLNQATANSIGLTFPRVMLLRADEMIG